MPEENSPAVSANSAPRPARNVFKAPRVLACVLCQQRKVKCDRRFPCANCVKASAQCVPATLVPRQRRRRVPERELLERLRRYESLLRQNKIDFEPLHTPGGKTSPGEDVRSIDSPDNEQSDGHAASLDEVTTGKEAAKTDTVFEARLLSP